ncbi:MAG: bacterial transcriptional activator domain-containing protein [Chloroflexia bacterium]
MRGFSVSLFGRFTVKRDDQPLSGIDACKLQDLLSYLLLYRNRAHSRDVLAGLLWGESPGAQAKKYLRQALWQLQSILDCSTGQSNYHLLQVEPDWVRIDSEPDLWLDVEILEHAYSLVQRIPGEQMDTAKVEIVQRAVTVYTGDLLENCYHDWCLYERERLQNIYLVMLDKLMDHCEAHGQHASGVAYGEHSLHYNRARERTHQRLMRMRYFAGDRTAALRQYERCRLALDEELGVEPSKRTTTLYEQIQRDAVDEVAPAASESYASEANTTAPVSLSEVLSHLRGFQVVLTNIQQQVQQDIRAVELFLHRRR